ncbi:putative peptidoglycan binding domain-containing protein [Carex littledalei]|uniref:Putative peptidoglycan binding domain-containing protein n=1 Tax=Carex littledalei TaxID=544730 RepID=A0A833VE24_9POAL|nr:putative peptidoglycan binding domain-containing protein [Carex littledalei]
MATTLPLQHSRFPFLSRLPRVKSKTFSQNSNPNIRLTRFTLLCSSSSSWDTEETRWLREEQRWLREEQRWLREEARWREERERLLAEIGILRLKLEMVEKERLTDVEAVVARPRPVLVEKAEVKEMLLEETVKVEEAREVREVGVEEKREAGKKKKPDKRTLRVGAEGEDVRDMQEALQKLGFYCGEEDTEFFSFSSGTQRAVKTWQATLGIREDGIMTEELLEMLYSEQETGDAHVKEGVNGAAVASVAQVAAEIEKTVVKESSAVNSGEEVYKHRVFLLGENRWEEPSRLVQNNNNQVNKSSGLTSGTKCLSCRGEGRLMCIECDGSGEPNIEEQFLEWIDEGAKCPYCEGLGYTICDLCEGKTFVQK